MEYNIVELLNQKPKMAEKDYEDLKFNCWLVEDGTKYKALADSKVKKRIEPGIYETKSEPHTGEIYLQEMTNVSDGLLRFNNSIIDKILKDVDNFWSHKEDFKKFKMVHKRGLLLSGAPGTGKSCAITLISEYIKEKEGIVINITPSSFLDTCTLLTAAFRKIEKETPVVIIMEDIDQYPRELTPFLLDFLDGKKSIENIMVVMTSNNTSNMSDAILRPGRVDKQYIVPELREEDRRMYFEFKGFSGVELDKLVSLSNGLNVSQCKEFIASYAILGEDAEETINYLATPIEKMNYMDTDFENNAMQL